MDLYGRVAIVTGAAGDIGRASAVALAEAGSSLVLVDLSEERLAEACAAASEAHGVEAVPVTADVRQSEDVRRYVDTATERFGRIDVLFSNAASRAARSHSPSAPRSSSTTSWP